MGNKATAKNGQKTTFGKRPQPTSEQKRAGWLRKKRGSELAKAVLDLTFKGLKDDKSKQEAAAYFGIPQNKLTFELMILWGQANKAIQSKDTPAANFCHDRAFGKPLIKMNVDMPNPEPSVIILSNGRAVEI